MKRSLSVMLAAAIVTAAILYSCNGGKTGAGSGTIGLYLTDDMSLFSQVTATINKVQLINTGNESGCDLLAAPVAINIANLADRMQLVDATQCAAGPYNRFRLQFDKSVQLMSGTTGTLAICSFTSYMDEGHENQPNILNCDPGTGICTLDVNGAVNVLAAQDNKLALDFDLKNFNVVNFGMPDCAVTMKVSPLTPSQMRQHGSEAITGIISSLDTETMTFDLTRGNRTFSVLYSGITASSQPDLNTLLQRAQADGLRTLVTTSGIDLGNNSLTALTIAVKVEGTVSGLANAIFTVNYGTAGNISVNSANAVVAGAMTDGSWVNVKLIGHDAISHNFIANKVEVESPGMTTEN